MNNILISISTSLILLVANPVFSNEVNNKLEIEIKLSDVNIVTTEKISNVNEIAIVVKNLLPKYLKTNSYQFIKSSNKLPFETIDLSISKTAPVTNAISTVNTNTCLTLINETNKLINELDKESEVPGQIKIIKNEIKTHESKPGCTQSIASAKSAIKFTQFEVNFPVVKKGMVYILKIARKAETDKAKAREWSYTYTSDYSGEWLTHFGFTFLDNKNKAYFSKSIKNDDDTTSYQITEEKNSAEFNYIPTLMFTYLDRDNIGEMHSHGISFGLGVDLENPSVLGGYSYLYGTNIMLTAGIAFAKTDGLNGRYQVGEIVSSEIDSDTLKSEGYDQTYFISLSYRFGDSPFGNK